MYLVESFVAVAFLAIVLIIYLLWKRYTRLSRFVTDALQVQEEQMLEMQKSLYDSVKVSQILVNILLERGVFDLDEWDDAKDRLDKMVEQLYIQNSENEETDKKLENELLNMLNITNTVH